MKKLQIKIQPVFWVLFSVALVFIPAPWLLSWIVAASVHEIFHLIALRLCGFTVKCLNVGASGACIESDMEPGMKMALCAMAGPISGFLLLSVVHMFPRIAICGLLQSLCNLLPIYPMDGSRVISGIIFMLFDHKKAQKISGYLEKTVLIAVYGIVCYGIFCKDLGIMPLILLIVLFVKKKFLANNGVRRYNMGNR